MLNAMPRFGVAYRGKDTSNTVHLFINPSTPGEKTALKQLMPGFDHLETSLYQLTATTEDDTVHFSLAPLGVLDLAEILTPGQVKDLLAQVAPDEERSIPDESAIRAYNKLLDFLA